MKKLKSKIKIEFLKGLNGTNDITQIFIWSNNTPDARLIDRLEMPENLTSYQKQKIRKELIEKYKDEE